MSRSSNSGRYSSFGGGAFTSPIQYPRAFSSEKVTLIWSSFDFIRFRNCVRFATLSVFHIRSKSAFLEAVIRNAPPRGRENDAT